MPLVKGWKFGFILEHQNTKEQVLFLGWETRTKAKFAAMRLVPGQRSVRSHQRGDVALYAPFGWALIDEVKLPLTPPHATPRSTPTLPDPRPTNFIISGRRSGKTKAMRAAMASRDEMAAMPIEEVRRLLAKALER